MTTSTINSFSNIPFKLSRNRFGRLTFTAADDCIHENVVPVRVFPISAPDHGFALVSTEGHELAWIDRLSELPDDIRKMIEDELGCREFVPEIRRLCRVSTFMTPSVWTVETDRGETQFTLRGEEDIRHLASGQLLIADSHGIHYLVRDIQALDKASKKILDRFL